MPSPERAFALAHAFHDAGALGIPPETLGVVAAGILTIAVVVPARAHEDRLVLPDDSDGGRGASVAPPRLTVVGVAGGLGVLVALAGVVVGLFGPASPNLASLLVANVVLPATVVLGLATGGPLPVVDRAVAAVSDRAVAAVSDRPGAMILDRPVGTWAAPALAVPVALAHPLGGQGARLAAATLAVYLVATFAGRLASGPGWWHTGDPLGVLCRAAGRLAPFVRGRRRAWPGALTGSLAPQERVVLGVVLAGAIGHAARFLPGWTEFVGGRPVPVRLALAGALSLYVFVFLALVDRALRSATGRVVGAALVPLTVALVLANDGAPALFSLDYAVTLLSDPVGRGADVFGTASRRVGTGLLLSPLVWVFQLSIVLMGGVLAAIVQRDHDRLAGASSRVLPTAICLLTGLVVVLLLVG